MAEDTDVTPLKLPRYNTNIPNKRKLSESFSPFNGGPGEEVPGSKPHNMSQTKPLDRATEDRMIAGNKSNPPHISRSRTIRESFSSGGYSIFKDFDSSSLPLYEITPISAGDFKLSDDPANRISQDGANKWTLTETITNLGIDAMPVSGSSRRNHFGESGFCSGMPQESVADSANTYPEEIPVASNSRHKQRAHSEPAGPRKALTISEEVSISDNIFQSLRHPGSVHDITAPENLNPHLNLFEGSKTSDQQGHLPEPNHGGTQFEKPNMYLHTLDSQMIVASDTEHKSKGRRKKTKNRNQECFIPALTANVETPRGSSPEKHMYQIDDQMGSEDPPNITNYNEIIADKSTLLPPKRESGGSPKKNLSPRKNASPKGKPQENRNKSSPAKATGGGGSSPPSPRSRSQDSSGGNQDKWSSPKKCEIIFTQNCHTKRACSGKYFAPALKGVLFKNIAKGLSGQLTCIASRNQQCPGFPSIQGLYTPDVEIESLFTQSYVVCDSPWDDEPAQSRNVARSSPRRHGTPRFFNSRRHSSESFRQRGTVVTERRPRGISQQAPVGRRFKSVSEKPYGGYGRNYIQDDRQLRFELRESSQSSVTSEGGNVQSDQSTEPPDEHSFAESRHSICKCGDMSSQKKTSGSDVKIQQSIGEPEKKLVSELSPRSGVSEDDDRSIASRTSTRSIERRSRHDIRQLRRSSEVSQRVDMVAQAVVTPPTSKQLSSGSDDRLKTDSGHSMTMSEQQFIEQTRQILEESFKGARVCARRFATSERVVQRDGSDSGIPKCKSVQYEVIVQSEEPCQDKGGQTKRATEEELSVSQRKPTTGRRTPAFASDHTRASKTRVMDKSHEHDVEAYKLAVVKDHNKYESDKSCGLEERKHVHSIGDRGQDGGARLFYDGRSEIQGPMFTDMQVYTAMCCHGNVPVKLEDGSQDYSIMRRQVSKDRESLRPKRAEWAVRHEAYDSARRPSDTDRYAFPGQEQEALGSNMSNESGARGGYSEINRSRLPWKHSACEVLQRDTPHDQTTPEHSLSSRYSGSGPLGLCEDRKSEIERRKHCQPATSVYDRQLSGYGGHRGSWKDESRSDESKSLEREKKRSFTANDQEGSHGYSHFEDIDEYSSRHDKQPPRRERQISTAPGSRPDDYDVEVTQLSEASKESQNSMRCPSAREPPVSGASLKQSTVPATDCSSLELTIASCADTRDEAVRQQCGISKERYDSELGATHSVAGSPYPSQIQTTKGYRMRSELKQTGEDYIEHEASSENVRCSSQAVEYSFPESSVELNSTRQVEIQRRSGVYSKSRLHCRQSKREYESAYDDDMDDCVSQEDASTSISRPLVNEEELLENYYDQLSQHGQTRSLRERPRRAINSKDAIIRKCQSERLSVRSSSKYEGAKTMEGRPGDLEKYPSAEENGKPSDDVRLKSMASRSSHNINCREEQKDRGRSSSVRDPIVTARESKRRRSSREIRRKQRKYYSSADTRSSTLENGGDSHESEDSENTLPASPGDLESDYLDDETEDKVRSGKPTPHMEGIAESQPRGVHELRLSGLQDSHNESHNSSSCRTTPLEVYVDKLRAMTSPAAKGKLLPVDEDVKKYLEFLTSKSAVAVERERQNYKQFNSDSCLDRRCSDIRASRNRHRTYCDGNSGVHQTHPQKIAHPGYAQQRSRIRTQSPKFQYYRKKSPQKVENNDEDDDDYEDHDGDYNDDESKGGVLTNNARSRSNSARRGCRSRTCTEGLIDLFEQVIIPEQPLQVDEYRHMHSIQNGVPIFCDSLRISSKRPEPSENPSSPSGCPWSICVPPSGGPYSTNNSAEPHIYTQAWKRYTDSQEVSSSRNTTPVSSSRHSFMQLKSLLLQSCDEKIKVCSHRRTRTQSEVTTVRPTVELQKVDACKDDASLLGSQGPNSDFGSERESRINTGNTQKDDSTGDLLLACDVMPLAGNKNFSSNAERDRNSSSGNGDSWYPEYAYRCGVIDTLRILDSDLAMSPPSPKFIHPCRKIDQTGDSYLRHHEMEDHLTYIMQSFPSLALCKQGDETFEIIRQNSLRALVYAAKLSVDWPPPNFYDNAAGNLENWIREVTEYSSASNVSSLSEVYSSDLQTANEKIKSAHKVANDIRKCQVKAKTLKPSFHPRQSSLPKVAFKDVSVDDERAHSPEDVEKADVEEEKYEGMESETEHSETTAYISGSDSHVYTDNDSSAEVTSGEEDQTKDNLEQPGFNQPVVKCSNKNYRSNASTHQEPIVRKRQESGYSINLSKSGSRRVTLHKEHLSPSEETRLRAAISRNLDSPHTFTLVPVSINESPVSTAESDRGGSRQSLEKCSEHTSSCGHKPIETVNDKEIQSIINDICEIHSSSPQKAMVFFVVAVDKQRSVGNERINNVKPGGKQSRVNPGASEGDGKHKYYIYTKDELIKTVAGSLRVKRDAVRTSVPTETQHLQASKRDQTNHPSKDFVLKRQQEVVDPKTNTQLKQPSIKTHKQEPATDACEIKSSSQNDFEAIEQEDKSIKQNHHLLNTTRGKYSAKDRSEQSIGKGQMLEKQEKCQSADFSPKSNNTVIDFIKNKYFRDEDVKTCKDVNGDHFVNLISNYKNKLAKGPSSQTGLGASNSSYSHRSAQCNEAIVGDQYNEAIVGGHYPRYKTSECDLGFDTVEANNYSREKTRTSEGFSQKCSENVSANELVENYRYSGREEGIFLTHNDKTCAESPNSSRSEPKNDHPKPSEDCRGKETYNVVHEDADTNKHSTSAASSILADCSRRSKSSIDLTVSKVPELEHDDAGKQKRRCKNACHHRTLTLLQSLVDGQLVAFFNKALDKITSPKHTISLHVTADEGKTRIKISNPDANGTRKNSSSPLSSEEDQRMSSSSTASPAETVTEKSLTEESVVILSLPAESRRQRSCRMSPQMKKQHNDSLQAWVNNSSPLVSGLGTKSDKSKEKYVLSAKRKRLVSKGRRRYRYKLRANREVQSSDSENITNSANDDNGSDISDNKCHLSPSLPGYDCAYRGHNRRLRRSKTQNRDNNYSPARRIPAATSPRSRRRKGSRKPSTRSETRYRSTSGPGPATRGRRVKHSSLASARKCRIKHKATDKSTSPKKSPKMRKVNTPVKVVPEMVYKNNKECGEIPSSKYTNTFATSGISRIARALNGYHLREHRNVSAYVDEPCDEGCCRRSKITEDRKHKIKENKCSPAKDSLVTDDDSLAGIEAFESCLLTPIKEESHSNDCTNTEISKSDFEDFVNKCRTKIMGITTQRPGWKCEHAQDRGRTNANCTRSGSKVSCLKGSISSGNYASPDELDCCEHRMNYYGNNHQEMYCPYPGSNYDCNSGEEAMQNNLQPREYTFSYLQYVVPYKSAFLRRQMDEAVQEEAPCFKNENELLKLYATGSNRSGYVNSARGNLTIPWALRRANSNMNWRNLEKSRFMSETNNPILTRSVPGVQCPKTRPPSASMSQTRTFSSVYAPYRPRFLCNISPQVSDYDDFLNLGATPRHHVSGDQGRNSKPLPNQWFSSDNADYHEMAHRNWNESANNGSDGSSCGDSSGNEEIDMREDEQRPEYPKRGEQKGKPQAGDAAAGVNDRMGNDKAAKEPRTVHGKKDHYLKQSQNISLEDPHFMCREHGCMPYDYIHQNYQVARVPTFAARNINGSGNMFGRGLHPTEEHLSTMQEPDGDSDDEFNSASEELPHYSSSCRKRPKYSRKGQEIDDTCNHPDTLSYYMGDGPSGQFDSFEGVPKEDLLINLSPVNAGEELVYCSHHPKNAACQRAPPSDAIGQASAGVPKQGRNECDIHGPTGLGHALDKNLGLTGRSCYGQGDILNKRVFTQWYVDEGEKTQQSQRRPLISVAQAEKCPHRERWTTPSEQCESSGDDGEEEDDDEENDCEDEDDEEEENEEEDDDGEEVEEDDDDDEEDDEEEDDEDNEDEDDEEDDEDENNGIPGQDLCDDERNMKQKSACLDHAKEKNSQNNYHQEKPQDINESKIVGPRTGDTEQISKRPTRVRTLTHTKRYTAGSKPGHQQSTGDHLSKPKQAGIHERNMQMKPGSTHQHKFSLEQIKVPAIEKERVRFACDENGDWAEIGRGSYGCVYLGLLDGVVEVAIKDFYESSSWDLVIHEARMLMFLQDTGITPRFYGLRRRFDVSKQPSEYCIIMEYFGDGRTLFNVMSDKMVLAGDEWMDIVGQLVAGLRLIHRKNVLINDLKADNILIDLTGGRKIIRYIDVGMATYKQGLTFQLPQDQMSKYNFLAPEVREGARTTTRSDIYSLGYMLEQMCRMADSTLGGLRKLVARCMEKNPARRPDIDDIVSQVHRFIASKASILINSASPREQFVLTNSV
ncbi:hypothetical protein BsWGS_25956 [Bradybaena similaris]